MAAEVVESVTAPTLLVVDGEDESVLRLNREVYEALPGEKNRWIVEGAGHLFEGPGELEEVADRAGRWFKRPR